MKLKLLAAVILASTLAQAQSEDPAALERKVDQLRSEVHQLTELLARMIELERAPAEKPATKAAASGFELKSGEATINFGGYAQFDGRLFEIGSPGDSGFTIRRLRPDVRGQLPNQMGYRLMGDFAGSSAKLVEGWMDWNASKYSKITVGQFKEPFSMEALQSAANLDVLERAMIITAFAPLFDVGVSASGKLLDNRVEYGAGLFNGRGSNTEENNDDEDVAARVVVEILKGLYGGGSMTTGEQDESMEDLSYKSAGRVPFFKYADAAQSDGNRDRWGADVEWLVGPASVKAEWLQTRQENIFIGATNANAKFDGFSVTATYFLTGEEKRRNHAPALKKGHGAWEVVLRFDEFNADDGILDSGLASGTDQARAVTAGVNWYPNANVRVMGNLVHVKYDDEISANNETADDEDVALLRLQYSL